MGSGQVANGETESHTTKNGADLSTNHRFAPDQQRANKENDRFQRRLPGRNAEKVEVGSKTRTSGHRQLAEKTNNLAAIWKKQKSGTPTQKMEEGAHRSVWGDLASCFNVQRRMEPTHGPACQKRLITHISDEHELNKI